jgi:hypothetical protein
MCAINIENKYSRCDITEQRVASRFKVPAIQNVLILNDKMWGTQGLQDRFFKILKQEFGNCVKKRIFNSVSEMSQYYRLQCNKQEMTERKRADVETLPFDLGSLFPSNKYRPSF